MTPEESALRSYRDGGHRSFVPPPPDVIVTRARRRARTRIALAAAAVVAVSAGAAAIATAPDDRDRTPPVTVPSPTPPAVTTPTPAPTTPPSPPGTTPPSTASSPPPASTTTQRTPARPAPVDVRDVDWENTTIRITASREDDDCLTGRVRIADGLGGESGDRPHLRIRAAYDDGGATYGDLTGDGRAEAVVWGACLGGLGDEDASGQLLVVSGGTGELVGTWVGPVAVVVDDVAVVGDGRLGITVTRRYTDVTEVFTYRWNGRRYVEQ